MGDVVVGLYSIVNSCIGYINDKSVVLTCREKEDFERVCIFHINNKKIVKYRNYGIKTKYWKNKGGIQDRYDFNERVEVQKESSIKIMEKYSNLCFTRTRPNGLIDIRFKRSKNKNKLES